MFSQSQQSGNVRQGPSDPGLSLREGRARRPARAGGMPGQAATRVLSAMRRSDMRHLAKLSRARWVITAGTGRALRRALETHEYPPADLSQIEKWDCLGYV